MYDLAHVHYLAIVLPLKQKLHLWASNFQLQQKADGTDAAVADAAVHVAIAAAWEVAPAYADF